MTILSDLNQFWSFNQMGFPKNYAPACRSPSYAQWVKMLKNRTLGLRKNETLSDFFQLKMAITRVLIDLVKRMRAPRNRLIELFNLIHVVFLILPSKSEK